MTMRTIGRLAAAGALALSVVTLAADGQRGTPPQTPPNYDPAKEITLTGTVDAVKNWMGPGAQGGVHLMLKTAREVVEIDLGPGWFLEQEKYRFAAGDELTVIGVRTKMAGRDGFIPRLIRRGDTTMTFRDEKGIPRWSRRGRG
jgi:hypothetical protein